MTARMYGNNAAKAAIEMALHDLVGRATGRPAYALLGGKQRSRMAVLGVISTGELASDLREAEKKKAEGYRRLQDQGRHRQAAGRRRAHAPHLRSCSAAAR